MVFHVEWRSGSGVTLSLGSTRSFASRLFGSVMASSSRLTLARALAESMPMSSRDTAGCLLTYEIVPVVLTLVETSIDGGTGGA